MRLKSGFRPQISIKFGRKTILVCVPVAPFWIGHRSQGDFLKYQKLSLSLSLRVSCHPNHYIQSFDRTGHLHLQRLANGLRLFRLARRFTMTGVFHWISAIPQLGNSCFRKRVASHPMAVPKSACPRDPCATTKEANWSSWQVPSIDGEFSLWPNSHSRSKISSQTWSARSHSSKRGYRLVATVVVVDVVAPPCVPLLSGTIMLYGSPSFHAFQDFGYCCFNWSLWHPSQS